MTYIVVREINGRKRELRQFPAAYDAMEWMKTRALLRNWEYTYTNATGAIVTYWDRDDHVYYTLYKT